MLGMTVKYQRGYNDSTSHDAENLSKRLSDCTLPLLLQRKISDTHVRD
jgi:hypothetical protein